MPTQNQALDTRQQLAFSPRLQQAVRLLQLSSIDFQQALREALETNPFLEADPAQPAGPSASAPPGLPRADEHDGQPQLAGEQDTLTPSSTEADTTGDEALDYAAGTTSTNAFDADAWVTDTGNGDSPSLHEKLHDALRLSATRGRDRIAAMLVIDSLDDDGYLRQSLADVALGADLLTPLSEAEMRIALRTVQSLDLPGIAARSPAECLALQLNALPAEVPQRDLALRLVADYLERLARREYGELQRRLGCTPEALQIAIALIRSLDPHPGNQYGSAHGTYVIPDVFVRVINRHLVVSLNPALLPRTRVHESYALMFERSGHAPGSLLSQQLQEARWLVRNAYKRCDTILRVAQCITSHQRAFFSYGEIALRPMQLSEVADELGLHESTVSRATCNKYMATSRGTFEFKRFFSRELDTQTGGKCSTAAARALISEIIASEDRSQPLSDVAITDMLAAQGISIARRTVTKYRTSMKVPPADLRRDG